MHWDKDEQDLSWKGAKTMAAPNYFTQFDEM
jgi:hypothetical protein